MAALVACPVDGTQLDPDLDHQGRPHGGARRVYCRLDCRLDAELARRREARRTATEARLRERAVAEARERERREPPLPGMPPDPLLVEAG